MYFEFELFHYSEQVCMGKPSINMAKELTVYFQEMM